MNAITDLKNALDVAQRKLAQLKAKRNKISAEIDRLEGKKIVPKKIVSKNVVSKTPQSKKRVKNDISLVQVIKNILSDGSSKSVKDIIIAIENSGYKSNSASMYSCVATVLCNGEFDRVSRGIYRIQANEPKVNPAMPEAIVSTQVNQEVENVVAETPILVDEPIKTDEPVLV